MKFRTLVLAGFLSLVCSLAVSAAEPNTLTAEELNDGWILLFDGETTFLAGRRGAKPIGKWPTA